ncbi:hypothetical protein Tco_0553645 [Tanacetum coccineum]
MLDKDKVLSEDSFNLYDILNKRKDSGDYLKYPLGFTSSVINVEEVNENVKGATSNEVSWVHSSSKLLIGSVYAPQDLTDQRVLWDYILRLIDRWDGDYVIMRDFNETSRTLKVSTAQSKVTTASIKISTAGTYYCLCSVSAAGYKDTTVVDLQLLEDLLLSRG